MVFISSFSKWFATKFGHHVCDAADLDVVIRNKFYSSLLFPF